MNIIDPNEFGEVDLKEMAEFEETNKIILPDDYKTFILRTNGGRPEKNINNIVQSDVNWIYGFHNGPEWSNIYFAIDTYQNRIPSWYVPIACDSGGNQYLMSLFEENYGLIAFWDHENETNGDADEYFANMTAVSNNFKDFMSKLE